MLSAVGIVCIAGLLITETAGVPLRSSGPGLMRLKDGKPVPRALPRAPIPTDISRVSEQTRVDIKARTQQIVDELLTREMKLQMDRANLDKFVTEILLWRKQAFGQ